VTVDIDRLSGAGDKSAPFLLKVIVDAKKCCRIKVLFLAKQRCNIGESFRAVSDGLKVSRHI
jgi:hypothetical protein